jgi:hypothetical protein
MQAGSGFAPHRWSVVRASSKPASRANMRSHCQPARQPPSMPAESSFEFQAHPIMCNIRTVVGGCPRRSWILPGLYREPVLDRDQPQALVQEPPDRGCAVHAHHIGEKCRDSSLFGFALPLASHRRASEPHAVCRVLGSLPAHSRRTSDWLVCLHFVQERASTMNASLCPLLRRPPFFTSLSGADSSD